jgi:hypothetical protein
MKKLLHDAQTQELNFGPNMKIMGEQVVEREHKFQALIDNLVDKQITFNVRQKVCLILLQHKLSSLQLEVKRKEAETSSVIDSRSCHKVVEESRL